MRQDTHSRALGEAFEVAIEQARPRVGPTTIARWEMLADRCYRVGCEAPYWQHAEIWFDLAHAAWKIRRSAF